MRGKLGLVERFRQITPETISGLTGWWDASDSTTLYDATTGGSAVAADGGVARLEDKSGNGRHFIQSTSAARPARKTSVQNSLDVLRFDGSDDTLGGNVFYFDDIVAAGGYTIFSVAKCTAASFNDSSPVANEFLLSENSGGYGAFYFRSTNLVGAMGFSNGTAPAGLHSVTTAYTIGNWAYFTQKWDGSNLSIRSNGGSPASTASDNLFAFTTSVSLGEQVSGGTFFEGDLGELVVYNVALSDTDRNAIESYLSAKWGL